MLRALIHHWRLNLAVMAGAAVATAVLTGALVVGDSVRGSLRALTEQRLGEIDRAVVAEGMFPEDLGERLGATPVIALQGAAENADSGARAARVAVWGVDERFAGLFPGSTQGKNTQGELALDRASGQIFPSVAINGSLARELGIEPGADVLVSFERLSEVPRETLLGRTDPGSALDSLRLTVTAVLADEGAGPARFGLTPHQTVPLNAFVPLRVLQRELDRRGEANVLLVAHGAEEGKEDTQGEERLGSVLTLEDLGLDAQVPTEVSEGFVTVQSREMVLRPAVARAIERLAGEIGAATQPVLTYLANSITYEDAATGETRSMPYSTVAALPIPPDPAFGELVPAESQDPPEDSEQDAIWLDAWAAEDLGASAGDTVEMTYYGVGADDALTTESTTFRVAGVVAMEGLAADRSLTPDFPGIADAEDISSWNPPFPVDLSAIRPKDETYWDDYRGTPKAFVRLETGQRLWRSRFGELTSIRLAPPAGMALDGPEGLFEVLQEQLPPAIDPEAAGFATLPVRQQGLDAATGATDFTGLFLAFSFFLIVAAALLFAMLFSLAVEGRASEAGVLLAMGYRSAQVGRRFLAEGLILALGGSLVGTVLAVGYAAWVISTLGFWWAPLLGEGGRGLLNLHIEVFSLAIGFFVSVLLVLVPVWWTSRRLSKVPITRLLTGSASESRDSQQKSTGARWMAVVGAVVSLGLLLLTALSGVSSPLLFFGAGAALLTAGIAVSLLWIRRDPGGLDKLARVGSLPTLFAMATRNSAQNPGRSLVSIGLVASATFVLVGVGAFHKSGPTELGKDSGAGGFSLVAESSVPVRQNLGDPQDRAELGLSDETAALLEGVEIFPLRLRPGEDASCLNLYKPEKPRLVGVTPALVERGGFHFRDALEERENPWTLLDGSFEVGDEGVVPAIGDYASVRWILQLGLGDELTLTDELGQPLRLRIVAQLEGSIFQSELLIPESAFLRHFPSRGGYRYFLIGGSHGHAQDLATALESDLDRFGFDATSTHERIASFEAVENTYLSTFQALGGLGLLLGTLGLGVVLIKNVLERRRELATLRAFGFRRRTLAGLVVVENAFLLIVGLAVGGLAGLAAVAPHLMAGGGAVPWGALGVTLLGVFVVGLLASLAAVAVTVRVPLLPVLKAE